MSLCMNELDQALVDVYWRWAEEPEMELADASDVEEEFVESVGEEGPVAAD